MWILNSSGICYGFGVWDFLLVCLSVVNQSITGFNMLTNAEYAWTLEICVFCCPFYWMKMHTNGIEIGAFEKLRLSFKLNNGELVFRLIFIQLKLKSFDYFMPILPFSTWKSAFITFSWRLETVAVWFLVMKIWINCCIHFLHDVIHFIHSFNNFSFDCLLILILTIYKKKNNIFIFGRHLFLCCF